MGTTLFKNLLHKLNLRIGKFSETSLKHRSAIFLFSVVMIFVDPLVSITFGSASLGGVGISVSPPQKISIGLLLLALLVYRLIAFWASVLLENGTDLSLARRRAALEFDPAWEAEQHESESMEQLISHESREDVYKWTLRQLVWQFVVPNILALVALTIFAAKYFAPDT